MNSILIIGGAGFIGSNLSLILNEQGFKVTIVDQFNAIDQNSNIKFIQGNFSDTNFLGSLFRKEKFDVVIQLVSTLIPSSDYGEFNNSKDLNSFANFELIKIMLENNSDKLIFFSSGGTVYGKCNMPLINEEEKLKPHNYYGFSKLLIEEYIQLQGRLNNLKYVIVRPSNPYGRGQKVHSKQGLIVVAMGKILNKQAIDIWGDGSIVRDYLHISDLCFAVNEILKSNNWQKIYNIGSGEGVSVKDLLYLIENTIQRKMEINYYPSRITDVPSNVLDISKIRNEIGWKPTVSLTNGIKDLWETISKN
jgi:UDP-glucose 4-epimerase